MTPAEAYQKAMEALNNARLEYQDKVGSIESLQQTIQQQQEKINALEKKAIENQQDILVVENNLASTQQELEQTKRELQESKQQQDANLETQIQRFNTLIDKLKNSEGKTLKFACGSTEPGNTQWVPDPYNAFGTIVLYVDTSSAGFSGKPFYFTSLGGVGCHWITTGATSIYPYQPNQGFDKGFMIAVRNVEPITPARANELKWHIQWLAVGI